MMRDCLRIELAAEERRAENGRGDAQMFERAELANAGRLGSTKDRDARRLDEILDQSKRCALESVGGSAVDGESPERKGRELVRQVDHIRGDGSSAGPPPKERVAEIRADDQTAGKRVSQSGERPKIIVVALAEDDMTHASVD